MGTPTGETRDDAPDPGESFEASAYADRAAAEISGDGDVPGDEAPSNPILASYQIRVITRGDNTMVEPALVAEINAKVKTAMGELMPGTFSNVSTERLDV